MQHMGTGPREVTEEKAVQRERRAPRCLGGWRVGRAVLRGEQLLDCKRNNKFTCWHPPLGTAVPRKTYLWSRALERGSGSSRALQPHSLGNKRRFGKTISHFPLPVPSLG